MEFNLLNVRQLKIFSLPEEILSSLYKQEALLEEKSIVEDTVTAVNNEPFKPSCLACGISSFDTFEQQRAHYKLEWHRFNVKRRAINLDAGKIHYTPTSEQKFEELMNECLTSVSDSETEGSDTSLQDDVSTLVDELQNVDLDEENLPDKDILRSSKPIFWFTCSNELPDDVYLGVYKHVLKNRGNDPNTVMEDIKRLQIKSNTNKPRYWTMLMISGGHFAGLVLDITQNTNVTNVDDVKVHVNKTFHRYTTRRKQGGSQANNDNSKGKAKSAGAEIRRYNESALQRDIRLLLEQWRPLIDQSEFIFVHAPGMNKNIILHYDGAILRKDDPRIRSIPFSTRRAKFNELKRCFIEFITVKVSQMSDDAPE
ncbi:5435_t:CDS:2 [Dentiscutata heterogama]|uniref:5435_t:CDS:1 n=1 Tax=Dentiscutata heterogama TaxID=1316150 RepID=A0ACA9K172_9GLOM|nr:5435_t:CDS:2 [Dentiscutata heterogama]